MAAVFLAKPERRDHSPKREESIDVLFDPSYFSLDSPFNVHGVTTMDDQVTARARRVLNIYSYISELVNTPHVICTGR